MKKIEDVIERGLQYRSESPNQYIPIQIEDISTKLLDTAKVIERNYNASVSKCSFKRLRGIEKKQQQLSFSVKRIEILLTHPKFSNEILQHIFEYLPAKEFKQMAQVNLQGGANAKSSTIQRACEYGYKGNDFSEAKNYLVVLFRAITNLAKDKSIPDEYIVRKNVRWRGILFFTYVDAEATYRKIQHVNADQTSNLKVKLSKAFLKRAKRGKIDGMEVLLDLGADIEVRCKVFGNTPLAYAAKKGYKKIAELLVKRGADVNAKANSNSSVLMFAVCNSKSVPIARLLLENGGDLSINTSNMVGYLPLHAAVYFHELEMVQLLLSYGADKQLIDFEGKTAIQYAISKKMREILNA